MQNNPPQTEVPTWSKLDRIQCAIGVNDHRFADMLGLSVSGFLSLRELAIELPAPNVFQLLDELRISLENFWLDRVDYQALAEAFRRNIHHIPEKYTAHAFSKRRSVAPLLAGLRNMGDHFLDRELNHFQIHPAVFDNPDGLINIRFQTDLCERMRAYGFNEQAFQALGQESIESNRGSLIEKSICRESTPRGVYELLFGAQLVSRFDENWTYELTRLTDQVAEVRVRARRNVLDAMATDKMGSSDLCALKSGVGASFLGYKGLPHATASHKKCIHRGDSECVFEFNFAEANYHQSLN